MCYGSEFFPLRETDEKCVRVSAKKSLHYHVGRELQLSVHFVLLPGYVGTGVRLKPSPLPFPSAGVEQERVIYLRVCDRCLLLKQARQRL